MTQEEVNIQKPRPKSREDKYLIEYLLAEQLKAYINVTTTDPLTQLPNRRTFVDELERSIKVSERYEVSMSMARLDIDHFSIIDQTFGKESGEAVIKAFAKTVSEYIRNTDFIARWGEDEFIWLMPHTTAEGAVVAAEKMRKTILQQNYPYIGKLSCSIGICQYKAGESLVDFIIRTAKQKEVAKTLGRNRVSVETEYE